VGSFGAAFLCLGLPARAYEVLAAKTSGIAPARIAAPVLATACAFSLVALLLNETVVLRTAQRLDGARDGHQLFQSQGEFWYQRGNTLFEVRAADRDTQTLQSVVIYERDGRGRLLRRVEADRAHIEPDHRWRLENARFREFPTADPEAAPRIETHVSAWFELGDAGDLALLGADPRGLTLLGLREYIRAIEHDGRDTTRYRSLWHARLADPLTVLLFAALAVPLGLAVERARSLAVPAIQGVGLLAAYYALQTTAGVIGAAGVTAAVLAPWLVIGSFGAFGAWRFARASS
jgi:lipopolysaccharide export system permease protein